MEQQCQLAEVSRAGFYRYLKQTVPEQADLLLRARLQELAVAHQRTGHMGYTFGPKGLSRGCRVFSSRSTWPRSYCIKLTSQIPSSTSLRPTA